MSTQNVNAGWLHERLGTVVLWALLICTESAGCETWQAAAAACMLPVRAAVSK